MCLATSQTFIEVLKEYLLKSKALYIVAVTFKSLVVKLK